MSSAATQDLLDQFDEFFRTYYAEEIADLAQKYPQEQQSLRIEYGDLYQYDLDLADDYLRKPDELRDYAEEALRLYDLPADISLSGANVRLTGLDDDLVREVTELRKEDRGELVGIQGQVSRRTEVNGRFTEVAFECKRCGTMTYIPQQDGSAQEPHECQGCERQGPFQIIEDKSEATDYRQVRLELPPEKAKGSSNATFDLVMEGDLANTHVEPGDRIKTSATVHSEITDDESMIFELYGNAVDVQKQETKFEDLDIEEHIEEIEAIASGEYGDPLELLVDSIAPSIKGYEHIKRGIAMQLFGGVPKTLESGEEMRGNTHVLIIGDPGTGKSRIAQYVEKLAPRSIYTSGKSSSAAGLTASAVQDEFGDGGWSIEGGTVVKADKGIAAVDELDKMDDEDRSSMLEALSMQRVSVAKAGINATLPARTTLLGVANPRDGRFDRFEPLGEQFALSPELMSRFDLIFTVTDVPDEEQDTEIVQHKNKVAKAGQLRARGEEVPEEIADDVAPEISPDVVRAWIAYVREQANDGEGVVPVLTDEAEELIETAYPAFRTQNATDEESGQQPVPMTARKIDAIHRLSEAVARMRLSDEVERRDVEAAMSVIRKCLKDVGMDPETGEFDADVVETGRSRSQNQRISAVADTIGRLEGAEGADPADVVTELSEEFAEAKIREEIERLKEQGKVYNAGNGLRKT